MYSQFFYDDLINMMAPVASAYGNGWYCASSPLSDGGSALCQVLCNGNQIAAAKLDPRVIVCPTMYDPTPVDPTVIAAYASMGATAGMSMGALIATLAEVEPIFGMELTQ